MDKRQDTFSRVLTGMSDDELKHVESYYVDTLATVRKEQVKRHDAALRSLWEPKCGHS
jgi:hypothetical protein